MLFIHYIFLYIVLCAIETYGCVFDAVQGSTVERPSVFVIIISTTICDVCPYNLFFILACFAFSCSQKLICLFFYPLLGTPKLMSGTKRRYEQLQPQLQRDIVHDYRRGVRGYGYIAIAQKHQLPVPTVQSVIARAERAGGNPVARSQEEEAEQRRAGEVVQ